MSEGTLLVGTIGTVSGFPVVSIAGYGAASLARCIDVGYLPGGVPNGNAAYGVAYSPDGSKCAVLCESSPRLRVYNTSNWSAITISGGDIPAAGIGKPAWSPDGSLLAIGHPSSPYLTVYNTATWTKNFSMSSPPGTARKVAFNADGTRLAVAHSTSPFLTVYNTSSWASLTITDLPAGAGQCCAWSPDGTKLALGHTTSPYLTVYQVSDWSKITITGGSPIAAPEGVHFSPDGTKLACAHAGSPFLTVYQVSDWSKLTITGGNPAGIGRDCAFSPDGTRLAVGHETTPFLTVYQVSDWSKLTITGAALTALVYAVGWSSNSYIREVTSGTEAVLDDTGSPAVGRTVRLYERAGGNLLASTTTDANGDYRFRMLSVIPTQVVALDDDAGTQYNDLILGWVVPAVPA